jgi:hypothetical protein
MRRNLGWLTQPGLISLFIKQKIKKCGKDIIRERERERERGTKI